VVLVAVCGTPLGVLRCGSKTVSRYSARVSCTCSRGRARQDATGTYRRLGPIMSREPHCMPAQSSTVQWAAQLSTGTVDAIDAVEWTLTAADACDDPAIFTLRTPEAAGGALFRIARARMDRRVASRIRLAASTPRSALYRHHGSVLPSRGRNGGSAGGELSCRLPNRRAYGPGHRCTRGGR
jgi:hypothetical protein